MTRVIINPPFSLAKLERTLQQKTSWADCRLEYYEYYKYYEYYEYYEYYTINYE